MIMVEYERQEGFPEKVPEKRKEYHNRDFLLESNVLLWVHEK